MNTQIISVKHQAYIEHLMDGKGTVESGRLAGFTHAARDALPIIVEPLVQRIARKNMRGKLELEAAPMAYRVLMEIMNDTTTDKRLRSDIAKYLHSSAGYTPPKASEPLDDGQREKAPHEMTTDELHRFIEDGEAVLADRALPANGIADML